MADGYRESLIKKKMAYEDKYQEFEQYLRSSEPDKVQRAKNWSIAIGLQQVDGLTPSDFLVSQAKENIEGKISTDDVRHRLEEYYQQKDVREKAEADRTLEADGVSERINALLAQRLLPSPLWNWLIFMATFSRVFYLMLDCSAHITLPRISGSLTEIQSNTAMPET